MTRFARMKGSKSSNEKKLEEASSWSEMKNSMFSKKIISKPEKSPPKEKVKDDSTKLTTEWASLGDDLDNSVCLLKHHLGKKNIKIANVEDSSSNEIKKNKKRLKEVENSEKESKLTTNRDTVIKRKNKKHRNSVSSEADPKINESNVKKEKKRKFQVNVDSEMTLPTKKKKYLKDYLNCEVKNFKKQKIGNLTSVGSKQLYKMKKIIKSEYFKKENFEENFKFKVGHKKQFDKKINKQSKEKKKFWNNFEERKSGIEELIINGEKIPIVKFQGFYVTLEDAERLKKLRNEMIKEGISKAKIEVAIKLERRRAEKSLSRLKKSVCFHCRGHGHLLSNCPTLIEKENTSVGICYKCGSTEHGATECKVVRGTNFQFAECFICKEQGHIARQCPDNPRGLYPQGGACRECGDVTHLKKDCPQVQSQRMEETVTVGVRSDRDLECLEEEIDSRKNQNLKKKIRKSSTVRF